MAAEYASPPSRDSRESRLDLPDRQLRHLGIAPPFGEQHESDTLTAGAHGPLEWHARAGIFLQCFAIGGYRVLEPRRPALPLAERLERIAEIVLGLAQSSGTRSRVNSCKASRKAATASSSRAVPLSRSPSDFERSAEIHLGRGPIERHARAGPFLQGFAKGGDGLLEPRRPALPLAEAKERSAEIHLGHGPVERHARAGPFLQGFAIGGDGLLEPRRRALPLAERSSALPRFIWVMAQSSGTRARVNSCKASR